jgi:SAM-dependent methyltransferase
MHITLRKTHTVTDIREIDWNSIIAEIQRRKGDRDGSSDYWDKRAPAFARNASKSDYVDKILRFMKPKPHWSVLDVGCAAGTLAVPLAGKVKTVTGMDISAKMLMLLGERCGELGIENIMTVHGRWEDDWEELGIGEHDVAIASRSLITQDFHTALLKLNKAARKRVYISTLVGDGPYDRRMFEALGRELNPGPDYIYVYNLLYGMGIQAGIHFISYKERNSYENLDEAVMVHKGRLGTMTPQEEEILKEFFKKHLIHRCGKWETDCSRKIRWAVLWWDKEWSRF